MRNITLATALGVLLVLPGITAAGTLDSLSGTADCNTWSADLTISFRANAMLARVEYAVVLLDTDGAEVERFDYAEYIDIPATVTADYSFTGAWAGALDGNYTVTGDFSVYDIFGDGMNLSTGSFTTALACGSTGGDDEPIAGDPCLYGPRFWAGHTDQWPVTSLVVGGKNSGQPELLQMLKLHDNRSQGFFALDELVAAKLNLANGGDTAIQSVVDAADDYLADSPGSRRGAGQSRRQAMQLKAALAKYNRTGCPGDEVADAMLYPEGDFTKSLDKAATETVNLGTIKAMYR